MTLTYMWSKGVHACSIHVTRVISFALVNICKIKTQLKKPTVIEKKVIERNPSLDPSTSHYNPPDFFSASPSSNPLFCPVSLSIKSPFTTGDFLPCIESLPNHLTPINEQERISPYQIITKSNKQFIKILIRSSSKLPEHECPSPVYPTLHVHL